MKILWYTDLHLGKKRNSSQHNQDCIDFLVWALEVGKEYDCNTMVCGGDYHDNRTEINTKTLNYSQYGLELINEADHIKTYYHIVGNHDLHYRNTREVHSIPHVRSFDKMVIVNEPLQVENCLLVPFLFPHEYDDVLKTTDAEYVFGHFEFSSFVMAGGHYISEHGPDPDRYTGPKRIFSGHYHQRQSKNNIIYTGNTFPMDYSDAGDSRRGVTIIDTKTGDYEFVDWKDGPTYVKTKLSLIAKDPEKYLRPKASVQCTVDMDITYLEAMEIRKQMIEEFGLRSLELKDRDVDDLERAVEGNDQEDPEEKEIELSDMQTMIMDMLGEVSADSIDNKKLQEMFKEL